MAAFNAEIIVKAMEILMAKVSMKEQAESKPATDTAAPTIETQPQPQPDKDNSKVEEGVEAPAQPQ